MWVKFVRVVRLFKICSKGSIKPTKRPLILYKPTQKTKETKKARPRHGKKQKKKQKKEAVMKFVAVVEIGFLILWISFEELEESF